MAVELASTHALAKPWGVTDLRPWSNAHYDGKIGEIWYERPVAEAADSSLLIKLLFTSEPLSIQVHPDDAFARSKGLPRGKSEAWYILGATPEAQVALGLKQCITSVQLRAAVEDGSIENLVAWRSVSPGDVIFVPAGTIHAIGAGLFIAEIQQRSDATFRLFDHGRQRELHIDSAVAVAKTEPADFQAKQSRRTAERTMLVSSPYFAFEKISLPAGSVWHLQAEQETWLLVINGNARAGSFDIAIGDAVFVQSDRVEIHVGADGMVGLVAYVGGGQAPHLSELMEKVSAMNARHPHSFRATAMATDGRPETVK